MIEKIDGKKFELFIKWYLRLNGYFTVDNFIIHAADDIKRISNGTVGNYTDIDVLGIRMPYHIEQSGDLKIMNDEQLLCTEKIDIIIGECKTGQQNSLNNVWQNGNVKAIEYLIKFCGVYKDENKIKQVASALAKNLQYEDDLIRFRVILFSQKASNDKPLSNKPKNILCSDVINFLLRIRGECWVTNGIGIKSIHDSWDSLIKSIFQIANDNKASLKQKEKSIYEILQ